MKLQERLYNRWRHAVAEYDPYDEELDDSGPEWGLPSTPKRVRKLVIRQNADAAIADLYHRLFTDRLEAELGLEFEVPLREKYSRLMDVEVQFSRYEIIQLRAHYRNSSISGSATKTMLYVRSRRTRLASRATTQHKEEDQRWEDIDHRNGRIKPERDWGYS